MTPRQNKALQGLLTRPTKKAAAEYAGISESTMRGYLKDPAFMEAYRAEVDNLLDDATREAQQSISPALGVLREISTDTDTPAAVRVQASRSLLEFGLRQHRTKGVQSAENRCKIRLWISRSACRT